MGQNDWWEKHVLAELGRLSSAVEKLGACNEDDHKEIRLAIADYREKTAAEISALKVKSGVWGAIAGFMTTLGAVLLYFLLLAA